MKAYDIRKTMTRPPQYEDAEGEASFWMMESFNEGMTWVGRFSGPSPWERHPDGDELLHVLEGEVEVTVLTEGGAVQSRFRRAPSLSCPGACGIGNSPRARCCNSERRREEPNTR